MGDDDWVYSPFSGETRTEALHRAIKIAQQQISRPPAAPKPVKPPKPKPTARAIRDNRLSDDEWDWLSDKHPDIALAMVRRTFHFDYITPNQLQSWCRDNLTGMYVFHSEEMLLRVESDDDLALVEMKFGGTQS